MSFVSRRGSKALRFVAAVCVVANALGVACGGNVFRSDDDRGTSGGTSSSGGGTNGKSGASSMGASSMGGSAAAGSIGTAGTPSSAGGPSCANVDCPSVDCGDDQVPVRLPGACCTTCQDKPVGCEDVKCYPLEECRDGYVVAQPPGACCSGCMPKSPPVPCIETGCPQECAPGYVRGDLLGGCCYECLPDPLYCRGNADCVMADKPRSCCGCPEAITRRQYDSELCWSELALPRPIPQSCYPQVTCDALCGACPQADIAACVDHRCTLHSLDLK